MLKAESILALTHFLEGVRKTNYAKLAYAARVRPTWKRLLRFLVVGVASSTLLFITLSGFAPPGFETPVTIFGLLSNRPEERSSQFGAGVLTSMPRVLPTEGKLGPRCSA